MVDLVSVDPFVFVSPQFEPLSIITGTREEAQNILALDESGQGWKIYRLSDLVQRGGNRVLAVSQAAKLLEESSVDSRPSHPDL